MLRRTELCQRFEFRVQSPEYQNPYTTSPFLLPLSTSFQGSRKVNKNHNSDNFIYNTLEELYFIYSFKCDDEVESGIRGEGIVGWTDTDMARVLVRDLPPLLCLVVGVWCLVFGVRCLVNSMKCLGRVAQGLNFVLRLLRFASRCVCKLSKSVCISAYETHVDERSMIFIVFWFLGDVMCLSWLWCTWWFVWLASGPSPKTP